MTYRVVFTARARADTVRHSSTSPTAAAKWYAGLEKAVASLRKMPLRHSIAEDESEQLGISLRQKLYGRRAGVFRILYSIEGETVVLHSVRHSAQRPVESD